MYEYVQLWQKEIVMRMMMTTYYCMPQTHKEGSFINEVRTTGDKYQCLPPVAPLVTYLCTTVRGIPRISTCIDMQLCWLVCMAF